MFLRMFLVGTILLAMPASLCAQEGYDWETWRKIVVQDGGRMKPLDSLATEFVIGVTGRAKFQPELTISLSPTDVKDWPGLAKALKLAGELNQDTPQKRVWGRLSSNLKTDLKANDLDAAKLTEEKQKADEAVMKLTKAYYDEHQEILSVEKLRSVLAKDSDATEVLKNYDAVKEKLKAIDAVKAKLVEELNGLLGQKDLTGAATDSDASQSTVECENLAWLQKTFSGQIENVEPAGKITVEHRKYSAVELYVTWLLTWQGWDRIDDFRKSTEDQMRNPYWAFHQPDAWDMVPMIDAHHQDLHPMLKPEIDKAVSVKTAWKNTDFETWVREVRQKARAEEELTPLEEKVESIHVAALNFAHHRIGQNLSVGPYLTSGSSEQESEDESYRWLTITELLFGGNALSQPQYHYSREDIEKLRSGFFQARQGLLTKTPSEFNAGTAKFAAALERMGKDSTFYTESLSGVAHELHYNDFNPFLMTTILSLAATVLLSISLGVSGRGIYYTGFTMLLAALAVMVYGMGLRSYISGRAPVTNMYETIIWSSFIMSFLAVTLGLVYRQRIIPTTAAITLTLSTLLAYNMPIDIGTSFAPLQPVLRSNYWLTIHVLTIVASYGAFMLAWALGNVGLVYYLVGKDNSEVTKPMALFCYRAVQVGVLLLAAGTILGGWWAADSWGRFWGWDPKEVWALIALVGYLVVLHSRYVGWVRVFGMMVGSVVAFSGIVMAWYGVNFVFGAGLHAYAFGDGGRIYVAGAALANLAFVGAVCRRSLRSPRPAPNARAAQSGLNIARAGGFRDLSTPSACSLGFLFS